MAYFLGIDQSYTSCGLVIIDDKAKLIKAAKFVSPVEVDKFRRAWLVSQHIQSEYINKYAPEMVGIEGLAFSMKGNATRDLAGLQFTIVNSLRATGYDEHNNEFTPNYNLLVVAPNELKKFASGDGRADKPKLVDCLPQNVLESFQKQNFRKTTGLYDVTDAYWLSRFVLEVFKHRSEAKTK